MNVVSNSNKCLILAWRERACSNAHAILIFIKYQNNENFEHHASYLKNKNIFIL